VAFATQPLVNGLAPSTEKAKSGGSFGEPRRPVGQRPHAANPFTLYLP